MPKDLKIVSGKQICLFCGQEKEMLYDETRAPYYECTCPDAVKTREITAQIVALKRTLPEEKYRIQQESVLYLKST